MNGVDLLALIQPIIFAMLCVSLFLAFVRLVRGPSLSDRVVALDLTAVLVVGFIAMYALSSNQPVFLDAAIVLALVAFLSTVAFARYLERRAHDE
jgi:multicomponent Na+:H+ antiporter subunit F